MQILLQSEEPFSPVPNARTCRQSSGVHECHNQAHSKGQKQAVAGPCCASQTASASALDTRNMPHDLSAAIMVVRHA